MFIRCSKIISCVFIDFQIIFTFQNTPVPVLELPGIVARIEPVATNAAKCDLLFSLSEQRASNGAPEGIEGTIEYRTDLFDRRSVEATGVGDCSQRLWSEQEAAGTGLSLQLEIREVDLRWDARQHHEPLDQCDRRDADGLSG